MYNGRPSDPDTHHKDISYITQADNHLPLLTVRETLWFSSECNLPPNLSPEAREHRLDVSNCPYNYYYSLNITKVLLQILGLTKVQDTYIGNDFVRGVSGGQKKRVTIGIDLMKGANIYLLVWIISTPM